MCGRVYLCFARARPESSARKGREWQEASVAFGQRWGVGDACEYGAFPPPADGIVITRTSRVHVRESF